MQGRKEANKEKKEIKKIFSDQKKKSKIRVTDVTSSS